ncbi:hypothetical protein ACP4OV_027294 [Aristida adscensionis]
MGSARQRLKIFTEDEIIRITTNYSKLIGKGGFGEVYRGSLDHEYDLVAVKRYIRQDLREEFMEEVNIHSQLRHRNVVHLVGYCLEETTLTMVTEYMPKGNLDNMLRKSNFPIPLDMRLGIAVGCAEALSYMHSMHLSRRHHTMGIDLVCHGDVKPANILLDDNLTAKLSDFGLSRLLLGGVSRYTSKVIGSIDYMDPIYIQKGLLTPRSDVYSFGIVLLELITRRRVKEGKFSLIESFSKACAKWKELRKIVDAEIATEENLKVLMEIGKLAINCLSLDIDKRPRMDAVAERLRMLWNDLRGRHDKRWRKKSFGSSGRNGGMHIPRELMFVRFYTNEELKHVTENYSYQLNWSTDLYKGTLEDNTVVVVRKNLSTHQGWLLLPHVIHKNIINVLGLGRDGDLILVYEYASKGSLASILDSQGDFPLDLRVKVAVEAAEALACLHSPRMIGIIEHGNVLPSNILLDANFVPKLTGFSRARAHSRVPTELTMESETGSHRPRIQLLEYDPDRSHLLAILHGDISSFGIVLLALIDKYYRLVGDGEDLVCRFSTANRVPKSLKPEEVTVIKEIKKLALKCTNSEVYERPTMEEVVQRLQMINRYWRKFMVKRGKQVTKTEPVGCSSQVGIAAELEG